MIIRNAKLSDGRLVDIPVEGNVFGEFAAAGTLSGSDAFDAKGMRILPPFYNCHAHSPMVLLRGYADDLELFTWLNEHIWPAEAKLVPEDIYIGSKLAIVEMIKSGTVFFRDMYFMGDQTIKAAEELGVRLAYGITWLNPTGKGNPDLAKANQAIVESYKIGKFSSRISLEYAPHAIYTVPEGDLKQFAEWMSKDDMLLHMHMSETKQEVENCKAAHGGLTPVEYIKECGLLNNRARFAHCVWLTDHDIELMAEAGAVAALNTTSNMKLASGLPRFKDMDTAGVKLTLGTDGCASNNSHSMFSEMKIAAIAAKIQSNDPTAGTAEKIFRAATVNGAASAVKNGGEIRPGALADAMFINEDQPYFIGDYNWVSNLVYAGETNCVDSVMCDGKMLMTHREIPGEEEIKEQARKACDKFRR